MSDAPNEIWWKARGRYLQMQEGCEQALSDIRDLLGHVSKCPNSADPNAGATAIALIRQMETCACRARDALSRR